MAEQLPGRPCADVKNMYHSLVRSGKIARSDKPRRSKLQPLPPPPPQFERTRYTRSRPSSKRQKTEMSQWNSNSNIYESKQFRKSGIPLVVAAPAFCSPNTRNAARVLMSLDASSNSNSATVNSDDPSQKPLNKENDDTLSTPTEHFFCKVYSVSFNSQSNNDDSSTEQPQQLIGFATLPSAHLTFSEARAVLQKDLAHKQLQQHAWRFCVPGQGTLSTEQEETLRVNFLVTREELGTVSAPLTVTIEVE